MRKKAVVITVALLMLFVLTAPYSAAVASAAPLEGASETASETAGETTFGVAAENETTSQTKYEKFKDDLYRNFIKGQRYKLFIKGLGNTLLITVLAVLVGIVLGFMTASVRYTYDEIGSKSKGFFGVALKILNRICRVYLTVIRGTPMMVQLLIIYYVIFASVSINKVVAAVIGFGINSGAYVAEIVRSGLMSIDRGQMEAGRSLGLGYIPTMIRIIVPQAFKNILPALGNELIVLLKETSIAGYIALPDLTRAGDIVRGDTYSSLPLIAVALIYLAVVMVLAKGVTKLELHLRKETKGAVLPAADEPQEEEGRKPEEWLG